MPDTPAHEIPTRPLRFDTDGRIASRAICVGCGYSLRGLDLKGTCPECGLQISISTRPNLLLYSQSPWLQRLRSGATWGCAGLFVGLPFPFYFCGMMGGPNPTLEFRTVALPILLLGPLLLGVWRLTTPEPLPALIERQISARRCCRIFVFLLTLAIITRPFVLQYDYTWDPWLAPLLYLLIGATGATFARHVQILFQRAHDERNMKYTRVMMMVFAFASLQSFVVSLFQVVSQEATWPQGDSVLVLISILLTVDMFVMFGALMFGIVLLKDLRGVLARDGGR